jgi:hypothetical protein
VFRKHHHVRTKEGYFIEKHDMARRQKLIEFNSKKNWLEKSSQQQQNRENEKNIIYEPLQMAKSHQHL